MHILVTGGGGYLGTCLVAELLDQGHRVRIFDRFCFGDAPVAEWRDHPNCHIITGDIRRLGDCPDLLEGIEAIAHLAGLANDPSCDLNPEMAMDVNADSTRELVSQALRAGVRRFVFASTCGVYGQGVFDVLDEQSPTNPVSTYSRTKLEGEHAVLAMGTTTFEPVIARPGTLYGWSRRMRFDVAVNQMVATAARHRRIHVFGGGRQWRPFIHVRDAARAMALLLQAPAAQVAGQIFNIGDDAGNYRIADLAARIQAQFPQAQMEIAKDDDDIRTFRVRFGKIRDQLGFTCLHGLDEGIEELRSRMADPALDPFEERYFNVRRMKQLLARPAADGGEPVAPHFIDLAKPSLGDEEHTAVLNSLRSGWLGPGPHIRAFETAFGQTVESEQVVATCSCTAALHLCLVHLGLGPGDEVITSPLTWASTGNTILHMGARVVFADIDPRTLNLDSTALESVITERTKVIMPVHLAGQPCDLDPIYAIAAKHGIAVVEDAAHALGAAYKGVPIGRYGTFSCFSFYAIKNITTIEGGAIAVADAEAAQHLRLLAANGMTANAWDRYGRSAAPGVPQVVDPGFKYQMGNLSAAMGVEQLKKFPEFKAARRRLADMYRMVLPELDEIELPEVLPFVESSWHLLIVKLRLDRLKKSRDEVREMLRRENIGTGVHFYGLHLHPYYRDTLGTRSEALPHATAASEAIVSLPLYPRMTDKNVGDVVDALKKVLLHARK